LSRRGRNPDPNDDGHDNDNGHNHGHRKRRFKWNGNDNGKRRFDEKGPARIEGPVENPEGGQIVSPLGEKPDRKYDRPPAFR